jgi:hypothetical protein
MPSLREGRGGTDQSQVGERLWEVAAQLPGVRVDLLGVQAGITGIGHGLVQQGGSFIEPAGVRQCLDEPKGASQERALVLRHAGVAVEQRALDA